MEAFLLKLLIFLAAAGIAVPLARKCKLGSVLGYLIAGIVIGPFGLSLIRRGAFSLKRLYLAIVNGCLSRAATH